MINLIVNEIVSELAGLPFLDTITGIVKPAKLSDAEGNIKTFPIAYNTNPDECNDSELQDLVPYSTKKSILYFEDRGTVVRGASGDAIEFTSNFLLVCWFNYRLINEDLTNSSTIAANIIKHLPLGNMGNITPLMNVYLEVTGQEPNDGGVFSRYSYREEINQYITYPYDYVALTLRADYRVRTECIEDVTENPASCL